MTINLDSPPTTVPHLMADFLELCIASGQYDVMAASDALSLINEDECKEWLSENTDVIDESSAEVNDRTLRIADECFEHIKFRQKTFGDFYPFCFEGKAFKTHNSFTEKHYLYLFLLFCSRLKSFEKSSQNKFANIFEIISAEALKRMLPNAVVKSFGKGSEDRKRHFGNKLKDAVKVLIKDLKESEHESINEIEDKNSGDGGLDVVAYFSWDDSAKGTLAFLGQCAAREEGWEDKKFEARKIGSYIKFCHQPVYLLFIPICYRNVSGEWVKYSATYECVLFDRLRICNLFKNSAPSNCLRDPDFIGLFNRN